tara:strand:+ start:129 stop:314 length:186 start_codon:yes stop_codon:yes gene_type:complete
MKRKLFLSNIGGMLIIIGLCIIMGADGVDILSIGPVDLLLSCLVGFGLMFIGGSIVIKANR